MYIFPFKRRCIYDVRTKATLVIFVMRGMHAFLLVGCVRAVVFVGRIFLNFLLTLLGPQSLSVDKLLRIWVVCPQNGTAVL